MVVWCRRCLLQEFQVLQFELTTCILLAWMLIQELILWQLLWLLGSLLVLKFLVELLQFGVESYAGKPHSSFLLVFYFFLLSGELLVQFYQMPDQMLHYTILIMLQHISTTFYQWVWLFLFLLAFITDIEKSPVELIANFMVCYISSLPLQALI